MADKSRDLMGYLLECWVAQREASGRSTYMVAGSVLQQFVEDCRAILAENQPVSVEYIDSGLALRLQDATVVPILPPSETGPMGGVSGEIPIGSPTDAKYRQGITPSRSFGITGPK